MRKREGKEIKIDLNDLRETAEYVLHCTVF